MKPKYLKTLDEIKKIAKRYTERSTGGFLIIHSSGAGGGLMLSKKTIEKYCGRNLPIENLQFKEKANGRNIFYFSHDKHTSVFEGESLYEEWLLDTPAEGFLEKELFEI